MLENEVDKAVKCVKENEASVITLCKDLAGDEPIKTVRLERKKVMPTRMPSPARSHVFFDVEGFVQFIHDNKPKVSRHMIIFADAVAVEIDVILDDRAENGFERATLRPPYHPEFILLNDALLDKSLPIASFAQGVMRNRKVIKDTDSQDARSIAMAMQQLTVATAIVQAIGDGKTSMNGLMTTTSVTTGTPEAKERLDLPDSLLVELPIYLNTEPVTFEIDITISTKNREVVAITDSPELEVRKFEVFEKMMAQIKGRKEGVVIVNGRPGQVNWSYNS